jgi:hypothetical protein
VKSVMGSIPTRELNKKDAFVVYILVWILVEVRFG